MSIVISLQRARATAGLSLIELSARSGIAPSNLSTIEHARRDPTATTIDRIAAALGVAFVPVSTGGRRTAADAATAIAVALQRRDTRLAYRTVIQLADDLGTAEAYTRVLLTAEPPQPTGTGWDAFLAAVTEWRLQQVGLPAPGWSAPTIEDPCSTWQPPDALLPARTEHVAAPFLRRGVLVETHEFASA